jgi:uncharacterized protein YbjQ (UPF0145 family)
MENVVCVVCRKENVNFECGICNDPICKACTHFVEPNQFEFLTDIPAELAHGSYCTFCYNSKVEPEIEHYNQVKERAKSVFVFFKHQGKLTRLMTRSHHTVTVKDCADREETLMRLAFQAAQANFNAVIDIDLVSEKVRMDAYQTSKWHAVGIPANINPDRYNR